MFTIIKTKAEKGKVYREIVKTGYEIGNGSDPNLPPITLLDWLPFSVLIFHFCKILI